MRSPQTPTLLTTAGVLCAMFAPSLVQAQVTLDSTVVFDSATSLYTYSYSVVNGSSIDLALVDIPVVANPAAVSSIVVPTGYQSAFDSGLGLVDFSPVLGATGFAPNSTVSGFEIVSSFKPNQEFFSGLDSQGNSFRGVTTAPGSVPEPGTLALGLTTLVTGAGLSLRRRSRRTA